MSLSRQTLLGMGMFFGGSVMLFAMMQQIGDKKITDEPEVVATANAEDATATAEPLTTDIETEKRILAQKQKEREARVAEQEQRAKEFLAEQEQAEAQALAKARAENERYQSNAIEPVTDEDSPETAQNNTQNASSQNNDAEAIDATNVTQPVVAQRQAATEPAATRQTQPAQNTQSTTANTQATNTAASTPAPTSAPTSPIDYEVKRGDGLIKLARQYNVPVAALAQANNMSARDNLQLGQEITIPSRRQVARLEREAAEAAAKQEALAKKSTQARQEAQQELQKARQEVKETDAKGNFGVQVALAGSQAQAEEVAAKFKDAGYQTTTSQTSRGVRVMVGPERGKVAALALKDKINSDPKVDTTGAWVLYWR